MLQRELKESDKIQFNALELLGRVYSFIFSQLGLSLLFRVLSAFCLLAVTPYLISALGVASYGVWSMYITTLAWIVLIDLGVGGQLRNIASRLIPIQQVTKLNNTFFASVVVSLLALMCFLVPAIVFYFDELELVGAYEFLLSAFVIVVINSYKAIFFSLSKAHWVYFIVLIPNLVLLVFVVCSESFTIALLSQVYLCSLVLSLLIVVAYLARYGFYPFPGAGLVVDVIDNELLKKGILFFIIQVVSLVIVSSDRVVLANLFSMDDVGKYDVVFKMFNALLMLFSVVNSLLWTKFNLLLRNKDFDGVSRLFARIDVVLVVMLLMFVLWGAGLDTIVRLWLGDIFYYSAGYIVGMIMYMFGFFVVSSYAAFLNGGSILFPQVVSQVLVVIVKVLLVLTIFTFFKEYWLVEYYLLLSGFLMMILSLFFRWRSRRELLESD